ncbi:sialidase family protein [Nonomuraea sp. NPDC046802]|uniref:sialidase family protein n=1 Tax=Nonomuraea sp. NPDC046802 TaxID=3154919 RepID=UPI0033DF22C5
MRLFRTFGAAMAAVLTVVISASPAAAVPQAPTYRFNKTTLWKSSGDPATCYRLPAVVKTKNNVLLAFAERRNRNDCSDYGAFDIVMRRSTDHGREWQNSKVVLAGEPGAMLQGNATVVADSEGPVFLFSTSEPSATVHRPRTPKVQVSTDDGVTWSKPRDLSNVIKAPAGAGDWFAVGPGHGIQLTKGEHKGRLVVPAYFTVGTQQSVRLIYSDDHGTTWKIGATATYNLSTLKLGEQTLVERTDGSILVIARNGAVDNATSLRGMARGVSKDGGETFDGAFRVDGDIIAPPTHPALLRQRWDGGPYTRILLSAPATKKTDNNALGMNVRSSFDEGATWKNWNNAVDNSGIRIDDHHAGYSDMVLIGNGAIGVLYEAGVDRFRDEIRWNWFWESAIGLR